MVNLQALADRELIIDTLTHTFIKGESIVENAMHLWNLVVVSDVPKSDE